MKDWKTLRLRDKTRELLEIISNTKHFDFVEAILLFGSEARGEARLTSDVDLALISTRPLTVRERLSILKNAPEDLLCDVDVRIACLRKESLSTTRVLDVGHSIKKEGVVIYENLL